MQIAVSNNKNHDQAPENESVLAVLLQEVRALASCQHGMHEELLVHAQTEETRLEAFSFKLDKLTEAFPEGDARGHREYHDALISKAQQSVKLRQAIIEKSLTALTWAAIVWISVALWNAFRHSLGLP